MEIDARELRNVLGAFATGVTVVTTIGADGEPRGFTANSFTSVSLDPPLVLVCLARGAASLPAFRDAAGYAVNILAEDQRDVSRTFASRVEDRFAMVDWHRGPAGNPVFDGTSAWLDCTMHRTVEAGDHVILIGQVRGCGHAPLNPLGYCRGAYVTFGLEQKAVEARGRKTAIGAILERDGEILLVDDPATGGLSLPSAETLGRPGSHDGLLDSLARLGVTADLSFLFAVFEETDKHRVSIHYRGKLLDGPGHGSGARLVPFDAIPWSRLPTDAVRSMLQRYVSERREDCFGIYVGDEVSGTVRTLSQAS